MQKQMLALFNDLREWKLPHGLGLSIVRKRARTHTHTHTQRKK